MSTGISIGGVSPESVRELREAINDILKSGAEQKTLRAALEALSQGVRVEANNMRIDSCRFDIVESNKTSDPTVG